MELKPYKNSYQHMVVDCPFCPKWVYLRDVSKMQPDALRDLKRHITNEAKNEALARHLDAAASMAHLQYFIDHTKPILVPAKAKRQYDDALKLK